MKKQARKKENRGERDANDGRMVTDGALLLNSSSTRHVQYAAGRLQPARKDVTSHRQFLAHCR